LLYGAGLRVGEALSLTLRDIDLIERIITVCNTKFFKTRLVPIGPNLTRELAAHIQRRRQLPLPEVMIHRYSPRARASSGPTNMSSGYSSISDEWRE
jgi:integrase